MTRAERLAELVAKYPPQDPGALPDDVGEGEPEHRFLLVERTHYDGLHYLTTHETPEDAADYHDGQEYPDDWSIVELIDLDTGRTFDAEPHTRFTSAGEAAE
jgi:hypothetical protein